MDTRLKQYLTNYCHFCLDKAQRPGCIWLTPDSDEPVIPESGACGEYYGALEMVCESPLSSLPPILDPDLERARDADIFLPLKRPRVEAPLPRTTHFLTVRQG